MSRPSRRTRKSPTAAQAAWMARGVTQPGGKLPLFDEDGQKVRRSLIDACLQAGWVERWFNNPLKPDWLVCRLTEFGRTAIRSAKPAAVAPAEQRTAP